MDSLHMISSSVMIQVFTLMCLIGGMGVFARIKPEINPAEIDPEYWNRQARETLQEALRYRPNENRARNIILFVGDGMSMTTVTASRILKGQNKGNTGEEEVFVFDKFPNVGLSKTYNVDHQIPDSAGTANAYHGGVKANYATIGVNARVKRGDCAASLREDGRIKSTMAHAQESGKDTGFVTTARISHASPAPLYAHSAERRWERDTQLSSEARARGCPDIAQQLSGDIGRKAKVVMGGGRRELTPDTELDPESGAPGRRGDGRNIITEWTNYKTSVNQSVQYVWNKDQLNNVDPASTDNLIGIFAASHLRYSIESEDGNDPHLADMTEKAIRILSKNPNGYFLFVEGAGIDLAHHDNYAHLALHDCVAFEEAVQRAVNIVDLSDTLIIVTADHSVPLVSISYSTRGTYILGRADYTDDDTLPGMVEVSDIDFKHYPVLVYGTGPGFNASRPEFTAEEVEAPYFQVPTAVPNKWESHDLTDVPIYATGAMGHLIHSTHEQNYIFHVIKYAGCMADDANAPHCVVGGSKVDLRRRSAWITWNSLLMLFLHQFISPSLIDEIIRVLLK